MASCLGSGEGVELSRLHITLQKWRLATDFTAKEEAGQSDEQVPLQKHKSAWLH